MSPSIGMSGQTDRYVDELRLGFARLQTALDLKLEAILAEQKKTNGRVTRLEDDEDLDQRIRKLEGVYQYGLGVIGAAVVIGGMIGALLRAWVR
jgi:hypothetical protein